MLGVTLLAVGIGVNFLDAYFSGNLSFSPDASDQNNKLSVLNRFGQPISASKLLLGTVLAVIGGVMLVGSWLSRR